MVSKAGEKLSEVHNEKFNPENQQRGERIRKEEAKAEEASDWGKTKQSVVRWE